MSQTAKKINFGLSKCYYAVITETTDAGTGAVTTSYGSYKALPGAVSISLSSNAAQGNFYADNGVYYVTTSTNFYTGDLELADITDDFYKDIFGDVEDNNGARLEVENNSTTYFALAFQTQTDVGGQRTVMYKCSAARPGVESQTTTESVEPLTKTISITAIGRADEISLNAAGTTTGKAISATLNTGDDGYSTFFSAVYAPTFA